MVRITSSAAESAAVSVTKCVLGASDTTKENRDSCAASTFSVSSLLPGSPSKETTASYSPTSSFPRLSPVQSEKVFSCQVPPALRYFILRTYCVTSPVVPVLGSSPVERYRSAIRSPPVTVAWRSMRTSSAVVNSLCAGDARKASIPLPLMVNSVCSNGSMTL